MLISKQRTMESLVWLKVLMLVLTFELVLSKAKNGPGFLGCFIDDTSDRALTSGPIQSGDQSVERCFKQCLDWESTDYKYAGLEFKKECFCGNNEDYARYGETPGDCKDRCSGNTDQFCGDSFRISIYEISQGVCSNIVDHANGHHSITNPSGLSYNLDNYKFFGTAANFYCDIGFLLQGATTITCEETENTVLWSDDVPTCEAQRTTSASTTTPMPVTTMKMTTTLTSVPVTTMTLTSTYVTPRIPETTEEATASHDANDTSGEPSPTIAEVTTVGATALPPPSTGNLYAGQIVGITVAVVLGVTIASLLIVIYVSRRKRGKTEKTSTAVATDDRMKSTFTNNTYGYPDDALAQDSSDTQTYYSHVIFQKQSTDDVVYPTPDDVNTTPDDDVYFSVYDGIQDERPTNMTGPSSNGQSDTEWVDNMLYGSSKLPTLEMETNGEDGWVDNTIYE